MIIHDWSLAPEEATHFDPVDQNHLRQVGEVAVMWSNKRGWVEKGWQYPNDLSSMDRLVARPTWLGEGLPPVGSHVHIVDPEGVLMYGLGESGKVIAHVEDTAVVRMSYGLGCFTAKHLRTGEQIAAEENEKAARDLYRTINWNAKPDEWESINPNRRLDYLKAIQAGYRKQPDA